MRFIRARSRGYLPHWEADGATYFVTYRLADSLPRFVAERFVHGELDAGYGSCALHDSRIAQFIVDAWRFHDGSRYRLIAWCVMPNHVHVVFELFRGAKLARVVHSWKSFTSSRANALLGRVGPLWSREYYDHLVRDQRELEATVRYVVENPITAGLREWPWSWYR
jgi:REP element-mobilizing transposase RayT